MTPIAPIGPIAHLAATTGVSGVGQLSGAGAGAGISGTDGASASAADEFGAALTHGFNAVNAAQHHANELAVQAATGKLDNPAQLTIATTKAQLMTQMATTIESKAVNAFNTIMAMR